CPAGRWELDCQPCRQSCSNNCHLDDGSCNEVCIGSMDPPHCITGCDNGGFGLNCAQKCPGHCLDKKCDGFNGKCVACEAGFTGATCNI
ncbi:multiple epidermal growth factor-like domains protein 11, partial [Biomphalaria glabrata]